MNLLSNHTRPNLPRLLLVSALALCLFLPLQSGNAQLNVVTATLTSGGANSINILAGQAFVLSLDVTTNFLSSGYTVFYQSIDGGAPFFQLIARSNTSPIHPNTGMHVFMFGELFDPFAGNAGRFMFGPNGNSNQFDIGGTGDQTNNQIPGTFGLQTVTVLVLAGATPGTYTIRLDPRSIMTERTTFSDVNMGGAAGPMFTVNIIPEPTTVGLFVMGGIAVVVAASRKRRAVAYSPPSPAGNHRQQ